MTRKRIVFLFLFVFPGAKGARALVVRVCSLSSYATEGAEECLKGERQRDREDKP